jgi:hypothetical protein
MTAVFTAVKGASERPPEQVSSLMSHALDPDRLFVVVLEDCYSEDVCEALDLCCALDGVVLVDLVEQEEAFCVDCLRSDSFEYGDGAVSVSLIEHLSRLSVGGQVFRARLLCSVWRHVCCDGSDDLVCVVSREDQSCYFFLVHCVIHCVNDSVSSWFYGHEASFVYSHLAACECDCCVFHCVSLVQCEQLLLCNNWLLNSGDVASSQVSPVRAAEQPRSGRLDGSSGVGATAAKAADPLAARSPCDVLRPGASSVPIALGYLAEATSSELVRRSSWDAAPLDAEGVPC